MIGSKSYSELVLLATFEERFDYLKLSGSVGVATFGHDRYLNQLLYRDSRWKRTRNAILIRDNGCDLADPDYPIFRYPIIHHIVPLSPRDIESGSKRVFDLENLICVSHSTHNAIHYGDASLLPQAPVERQPGDTCPWLDIHRESEVVMNVGRKHPCVHKEDAWAGPRL